MRCESGLNQKPWKRLICAVRDATAQRENEPQNHAFKYQRRQQQAIKKVTFHNTKAEQSEASKSIAFD